MWISGYVTTSPPVEGRKTGHLCDKAFVTRRVGRSQVFLNRVAAFDSLIVSVLLGDGDEG